MSDGAIAGARDTVRIGVRIDVRHGVRPVVRRGVRGATLAAAAAIVAVLAGAGRAEAQASTPSDSATLRVRVVRDSVGIEGAIVRTGRRGARTDARGVATLRLAAGAHHLAASRIGLAPETTTVVLRAGQDTAIVVALDGPLPALETVTVTATRGERRIEDEPIRVEVLALEEIEEKLMMTPGDVAMMLNETSGLRVQTTSPSLGGASVRVQGLAGRYTQLLSDGLPLYGGQAGGLGLLQIPPMDLGQVEVIKGAASALYGSSALGGVVNLVSRRPGEEHERELLVNGTSRAGSDGIAYLSGPLRARWGYSVLGGIHLQERQDIDGDGWTDLPGYRRAVVRPRLFWDSGEGRSLLVTAGGTGERRRGGTLDGRTAPDGLGFREALDTRRADVGAIGRVALGRNVASVRASAMEQRHAHAFGEVAEDDRHRTAFVEGVLAFPRERWSLLVGTAAQRETYANEDVNGFDYRFTTGSAFAQADLAPVRWLALSATGRLDEHSAYGTLVNPRLSLLLRAPEEGALAGWTTRASIGSGSFAPTPFTEETEVVGLSRVQPLRNLDVERATTRSLDVGGPVGPVEVNATLFGSTVRDPIAVRDLEPSLTNPRSLVLANAPQATRTSGAELLARYVAEPWHVTATWTHIRSTEWDVDEARRRDTPLVPRDAVGIVGMYELEDRGRLGVELYWTGRQALEHNPYRTSSAPYLIVGALVERHVGAARLFVNFENLTDVRQTRYDPLVLRVRGRGGRWTTDAWTELSGRTINGGVRFGF